MTDFYGAKDLWLWPVVINSGNAVVEVIEDPNNNSNSKFTNTVSLRQSDTDSVTGVYYANADSDTVFGSGSSVPSNVASTTILDGANDSLTCSHLYNEIVDQLEAESKTNGNSLDYQMTEVKLSGSDHKTGIKLTHSGSLEIQINFGASNHLDPRFFGFDEDASTQLSGDGTDDEILGPKSRWGSWHSPVTAHEKRPKPQYPKFKSSSNPRKGESWRYTTAQRPRPHTYIGVAGVHVWSEDRADRSTEASRGGLVDNDNNNALVDLWHHANFGTRDVIIAEQDAGNGLHAGIRSNGTITVGRLHGEFSDMFSPQDMTDRQHSGEKYDPTIIVGEAAPDVYASGVDRYAH